MSAVAVTGENFKQEVTESELPVLVDFFAVWCGPCKLVSPIVDQLAGEYAGKVKVCKVDVDQAQDLASEYGVMSVPTLVFFKGGEKVNQVVGALPKDKIEGHLKELL